MDCGYLASLASHPRIYSMAVYGWNTPLWIEYVHQQIHSQAYIKFQPYTNPKRIPFAEENHIVWEKRGFCGLADESLLDRDMAIVWTFLEGKIKYTDGWASMYVRLFAFGVEVSS